ncbi:hypothetical protein ACFL3T_04815 [Patescibacteria group bacterium]
MVEVYEKKVKDRLWEKGTKKRRQTLEEQKVQEHKEAVEREKKAARHLCAEYHQKLDKEKSYFDSGAMAAARGLLPRFRKLNVRLLPEALRHVILHRKTYLEVMMRLSRSRNIAGFLDSFSKKAKRMGAANQNLAKFKVEALKMPEYNKLTSNDFLLAQRVLKKGMRDLTPLLSVNNYKEEAKKLLKPPNAAVKDKRVDDYTAAKKLFKIFKFIADGLDEALKAKRKRTVLNPDEAPELTQKRKSKKV